MLYLPLGRTSITASRLAFGGWQASGWQSSRDQDFCNALQQALDLGVTVIDTAESYGNGHSEHLIGRSIKSCRDRLVLSTKFSHHHSEPRLIRKSLEKSLKRLQTDYIDIYFQHWPPKHPPLADTICELERLKLEGKIRAIGVSNWMDPEWAELNDPSRIDVLQNCYNLAFRAIEEKILPLCQKHSIAVFTYSPLCQGLLTGGLHEGTVYQKDDARSMNRFYQTDLRSAFMQALEVLRAQAQEMNSTPAALAISWILSKSEISSIIIGSSNPRQAQMNFSNVIWSLPNEVQGALDLAFANFSETLTPHDTLWNWHPRA